MEALEKEKIFKVMADYEYDIFILKQTLREILHIWNPMTSKTWSGSRENALDLYNRVVDLAYKVEGNYKIES
jgi:hypothetical protein